MSNSSAENQVYSPISLPWPIVRKKKFAHKETPKVTDRCVPFLCRLRKKTFML